MSVVNCKVNYFLIWAQHDQNLQLLSSTLDIVGDYVHAVVKRG